MKNEYGHGITENRPIFIDIDGTLTDRSVKGGDVIPERLSALRRIIGSGEQIVIWSGGGTDYVKWFCAKHQIVGVVMIGKPEFCVDDNPTIRPKSLRVQTPEEFFK